MPPSHFITARRAEDVYRSLKTAPPEATLLLDVDDTLMTPVSQSFRSSSSGCVKNLIDEIKSQKDLYPDFEDILSQWRLQRQIRLTDPQWKEVIATSVLQRPVYGLTQMNTGPFGRIPSMQDWRYKELLSLGLRFTEATLSNKMTPKDVPVLYKGILFTGHLSKSQTLSFFQEALPLAPIVFVDDRQKHLEDVGQYCQNHGLEYLGILYQEDSSEASPQDPQIIALQKEWLVTRQQWLEDDQAKALLST